MQQKVRNAAKVNRFHGLQDDLVSTFYNKASCLISKFLTCIQKEKRDMLQRSTFAQTKRSSLVHFLEQKLHIWSWCFRHTSKRWLWNLCRNTGFRQGKKVLLSTFFNKCLHLSSWNIDIHMEQKVRNAAKVNSFTTYRMYFCPVFTNECRMSILKLLTYIHQEKWEKLQKLTFAQPKRTSFSHFLEEKLQI